ncbi:HAD family hydrolase [Rhodococcus sp. NPDC060176]|uniref:HAD family hydrolase n=1 Tax=Rhodococcus sp. NPDC060176 TaxID=3347062 RepID=UPI00365A1191
MSDLPRLAIFDCDGVLVDTERIALRVQVRIGTELGWPLTDSEAIARFTGHSLASIETVVKARLGEKLAATWVELFDLYHRAEVDNGLEHIAGVPRVLAELAEMNISTCVASGGTHEKMKHTLGRTGLYKLFVGRIFSVTEVDRGKPAPDLFLHAAQSMGVPASSCVVIEDSYPGVVAARAAGIHCFAFAGGVTPADRLNGDGTTVFHEMKELPSLVNDRLSVDPALD